MTSNSVHKYYNNCFQLCLSNCCRRSERINKRTKTKNSAFYPTDRVVHLISSYRVTVLGVAYTDTADIK